MGVYKYIRNLWKKPKENLKNLMKERLFQYRREGAIVKIERPTRLDRARELGWKPKQGVVIVRVKIDRKKRFREHRSGGRKPTRFHFTKLLSISNQVIAERRAANSYRNCEVVNSYWVGEDGKSVWYEVILVDRYHPQVLADKQLSKIAINRGRAFRGLTSAARKSRGLRNKGKGAEKIRPSLRSHNRTAK